MARKRKDGKRVNGRLSQAAGDKQARRSIEQQDVMSVAREARERVWGVSAADSGTDRAGSFVGRLRLQQAQEERRGDVALTGISEAQYQAALCFALDYARYARALDLPRAPKAVDLNAVHGLGLDEEDPAKVTRAVELWDAAKAAVVEGNATHPGGTLWTTLYFCVILDTPLPLIVGDLRLALNVLVRHYRIQEVENKRAA